MIDSHCHLTDDRLASQVTDVVARAAAGGVSAMVTIGTTPADAEQARSLADRFAAVYFAAGIHPNHSDAFTPDDAHQLREFALHPKCVALGEMGLDDHWKDVPMAHQRAVFEAQLALATELAMPVVIHSRAAVLQTLEVMAKFPAVRSVFHCFTGTADEARAVISAGHCLGFTGPLTFKKNDALRDIVRETPPDRLLIETDAPYLTPEPHRSVKTNEPAYVRFVLETLAKVKGLSVPEADALTRRNTQALYRWPRG